MRIDGLWLRPAMPCKLPARSWSFSPRAECSAALSRGCPVRRQNRQCDVLAPLIAQLEFRENHVQRVVALGVAVAQAAYAFAPATVGLVRELAPHSTGTASSAAPGLFVAAAFAQGLAIGAFLLGRNRLRAVSKSA